MCAIDLTHIVLKQDIHGKVTAEVDPYVAVYVSDMEDNDDDALSSYLQSTVADTVTSPSKSDSWLEACWVWSCWMWMIQRGPMLNGKLI